MTDIYFTKELKLSIFSDFNSKTYNTLKTDFYKSYMKGESYFFLDNYKTILNISNLKNKGFNEIISFSEISFNTNLYNFDEPLVMNEKNKSKPNFPPLPFTAKSKVYTIIDSGDTFYDLQDDKGILIKVTSNDIKQHKLVCHIL